MRGRSLMLIASLLATSQAVAQDRTTGPTDEQVRRASDLQYDAILAAARAKGWFYPADQIASGRTRHFEETRQRLLDQGPRPLTAEAVR